MMFKLGRIFFEQHPANQWSYSVGRWYKISDICRHGDDTAVMKETGG